MAYEERDMSGTLYNERNKKSEKSPDMTGKLLINGKRYRISGWWKNNGGLLSLSVQDADQQAPTREQQQSRPPADEYDEHF